MVPDRRETVQQYSRDGYFQNIRNNYGEHIVKIFRAWIRVKKKISKVKSQRNFLLACRSNDVTPKNIKNSCKQLYDIHFHQNSYKSKLNNAIFTLCRKIHKLEIKDAIRNLQYLNIEKDKIFYSIHNLNIPIEVVTKKLNKNTRLSLIKNWNI